MKTFNRLLMFGEVVACLIHIRGSELEIFHGSDKVRENVLQIVTDPNEDSFSEYGMPCTKLE